jgi:hypothetical protein
MFQRFLALGTALTLVLTMAACGEADKAQPVSGSSQSSPSSLATEPPADLSQDADGIPQANDAMVRKIICTYGAMEELTTDGSPRLVPTAISLFYSNESWEGPEDLTPGEYFSWFFSTTWNEDYEYKQEAYKNPHGENMGWFYPQDLYEERIQQYFEISSDYLRSDPTYYDAEYQGYWIGGGGGKGLVPILRYEWSQEGEILTVDVTLDYIEAQPGSTHRLTVRLEPDGGWKYLSCQVIPAAA